MRMLVLLSFIIIVVSVCLFGCGKHEKTYRGNTGAQWKAQLQDQDPLKRKKALIALDHMRDKRFIQNIKDVLTNDNNSEVRARAVSALASFFEDESVKKILIESLWDRDPMVRDEAGNTLGIKGDEETVKALIQVLESKHVTAYCHAIGALSRIGNKRATASLIKMLKFQDKDVRVCAVEALDNIGDINALKALIDCLGNDQEESVREACADALGRLRSAVALPFLIKALNDKAFMVRGASAYALGVIGSKKAVPGLIRALGETEANVLNRALFALEKITGKNFGKDLAKWREWWEKNKARILKEEEKNK